MNPETLLVISGLLSLFLFLTNVAGFSAIVVFLYKIHKEDGLLIAQSIKNLQEECSHLSLVEKNENLLNQVRDLEDTIKEYAQFLDMVTDSLVSDTQFLKSELSKKLSAGIPEYQQLSQEMTQFENRIIAIKEALIAYGHLQVDE